MAAGKEPVVAPQAQATSAQLQPVPAIDAGAAQQHAADAGAAATTAPAAATRPTAEQVLALEGVHSTSLGSPSNGTLQGGVPLPDLGPGFVHNSVRPDNARYGTVELVQTIMRAAAVVDQELPGSVLVVNDLGLEQGGPIHQHGSHQNGRDADILFYSLDAKGQPLPSVGVPIEPDATGWDFKDLATPDDDERVRLDAPRTWRFVQALLEQAGDQVQRIFLVEHVRSMLLQQAERAHAPAKLRQRFADLTCQPETPHDDHLHVRLFCSPEDLGLGCWDKPPIYPWQREALHALGLKPVLEPPGAKRQTREDVAERTTSRAEARKKAGAMHAKVRRFLDRREAWAKKPSPGRVYCR